MDAREMLIAQSMESQAPRYPHKSEPFGSAPLLAPVDPPASSTIILPRKKVFLGLQYYGRFISDENSQLQWGMAESGYTLHFPRGRDIGDIDCDLMFLADPRDFLHYDIYEKYRPCVRQVDRWTINKIPKHVWKVAPFKDMYWWRNWQVERLSELGINTVVTPYNVDIAYGLFPQLRGKMVRTFHTVDAAAIPKFNRGPRRRCILSGNLDKPELVGTGRAAYPLRSMLFEAYQKGTFLADYHNHPGYAYLRCETPVYLDILSRYRVAVCSSSRYRFALRKIIEATACGCRVITDLDEELPDIGGNLFRIRPDMSSQDIDGLVGDLCHSWDADTQAEFSRICCERYDYKRVCGELSENITKHIKGEYEPCALPQLQYV